MHLIKDFWGSLLVAVIGIVVAGWWGANGPLGLWVAVWLVVVLSVLEVSLSFDNAVVNAGVLKDMNQFWRTMFLTVGILIAVFGMRLVFPVVIVAVSADMSAVETMRMALSDPDRYAETLNRAYPSISAFGGAFLLLVFLKFIFDHEKETHWLGALEQRLGSMGKFTEISVLIALTTIFSMLWWVPEAEQSRVFVAGIAGVLLYLAVDFVGAMFENEESGEAAVKATHKAGFASFLYLEVLDASFSFDGVIGAFAITKDVIIIMIGLAIGAMFVRSMTVYLVNRGTLEQYVFLEHGAHYAIGALAVIMIIGSIAHVPEIITGLIGVGFIAASVWSSLRYRKQNSENESVTNEAG